MSRSSALGYRRDLDGLRGVSILAVLAYHAQLPFSGGGFLGVDVFFVLSGFLITRLLIEEADREGSIRLGYFYARRALRLLPAVAFMLLVWVAHAYVAWPAEPAREAYLGSVATFFYVSNWAQAVAGMEMHGIGHTWSLSVEEQYYLVWPLLMVAILRRRRPAAGLAFILALVGAAVLWRAFLWHLGVSPLRLYVGTDTRADALLVGSALGAACGWGQVLSRSWLRTVAGLGWLPAASLLVYWMATARRSTDFLYAGGFLLVAIAVALILLHLEFDGVLRRLLAWAPLAWVGRVSYGVYLWHVVVFALVGSPPWGTPVVLAVDFAAVFFISWFSYRFVERPFNRYRERLRARPHTVTPISERFESSGEKAVVQQGAAGK